MVARMHRIHMPEVGESTLHLGGGVPYEVDDVQKYPLGSYTRIGRRGFVYAKTGGTIVPDIGAKQAFNQKVGQYATAASVLAGAKSISVTITATLNIAKDELAGGEAIVFPTGGNKTFLRGILSNNAIVTSGTLVVELDSPIPVDVVAGSAFEAITDPYSGVTQASNEWTPVLGMPVIGAGTGKFIWLQVEGISWCAPEAEVGENVNYLELCFGGDGALRRRDAGTPGQQRAGMILVPGTNGTSQGAPFIMLNIDH